MVARVVERKAKPGRRAEILTILMNELLPLVQKQAAFVDAIGLSEYAHPDYAITLTFWTTREEAEKFYRMPEVRVKLDRITPLVEHITVRTFNVEVSTFHKIAAMAA
jgi:hypothetical protein